MTKGISSNCQVTNTFLRLSGSENKQWLADKPEMNKRDQVGDSDYKLNISVAVNSFSAI